MDTTTRRALIGSVGLIAVLSVGPVIATTMPTGSLTFRALLDHSDSARLRFNGLPTMLEVDDEPMFEAGMNGMIEACRAADRATPTNWSEFVRLFEHMTDDGDSGLDEDNADRLLAHARRLSVREA